MSHTTKELVTLLGTWRLATTDDDNPDRFVSTVECANDNPMMATLNMMAGCVPAPYETVLRDNGKWGKRTTYSTEAQAREGHARIVAEFFK